MNLVLDTNTYRAFTDGNAATVRLIREADKIWMPVPVLAELRFGFLRGTRGQANEAILAEFLASSRVGILVCDQQTAHYYGELKMQLFKQGTPIPINDVWIAAITLQHRFVLHTLDSDFKNIRQLALV
ncbi:MAG: type II toxin-antitoxin system VapC family toxin [Myxococcaceae bacterium]